MKIICMECQKEKPEHRHGLCEECMIDFYSSRKKNAKGLIKDMQEYKEIIKDSKYIEVKYFIAILETVETLSRSIINMEKEIENLSSILIQIQGQGDLQ